MPAKLKVMDVEPSPSRGMACAALSMTRKALVLVAMRFGYAAGAAKIATNSKTENTDLFLPISNLSSKRKVL